MEAEKYQKELFEFESPKKAAPRFGGMFPRTDFVITLTPEKMVFAAIGVIMLMVIFFALGVEKGKTAGYSKFTQTKTAHRGIVEAPAILVSSARAPIVVAKSPAVANITPKVNPATVRTQAEFDKTKPYMIVAAAFSREDFALKEVGRLKTAGLEAFVYYGEPYYLACVGSFKDRTAANTTLSKVKRMHQDAYVRMRY